jgi:hypothetical protein
MKVISTKVHGVMDYFMGVLLIAAPWLFNFAKGGAETWVPVALGVATIVYSLITDYEMGVSPQISMKTHLTLDTLSGIFLAASPWIFDFRETVYLPHLILGLAELAAVAMTDPTPSYRDESSTVSENRHTHAH